MGGTSGGDARVGGTIIVRFAMLVLVGWAIVVGAGRSQIGLADWVRYWRMDVCVFEDLVGDGWV